MSFFEAEAADREALLLARAVLELSIVTRTRLRACGTDEDCDDSLLEEVGCEREVLEEVAVAADSPVPVCRFESAVEDARAVAEAPDTCSRREALAAPLAEQLPVL